MIQKLLGGIAGVGIAGTVAAAFLQPAAVAPVISGTGGAMGATAAAMAFKKKDEEATDEANRVSSAFSYLYETNRGLVAPNQLSLLSGVPLDRIERFLSALSNEQGGQFIPTNAGPIVNFPHPANMLQEMTNNSANWAQEQINQIGIENAQLKKQMALINAARMSKAGVGGPVPKPQVPTNGAAPQPNNVEPWNSLL